MSKIKTFRGLMANNTQVAINLHTITGRTGYRIKKFELMPNEPGVKAHVSIVKVYALRQTTNTDDVNFGETDLLAAGVANSNDNAHIYPMYESIIYEETIVNQDIFVTHKNAGSPTESCNYYLELEQITLDSDETAVATLKNIKNR
jgi:hypothetical protein|tara:strand:+ start:162 stop:599 length:438 start_codon:yes stop_codon:yes gene_type:complete